MKTISQGVRRKTLYAKYEKNARMAMKIDTNNKRVNFSQRWNNLYGHNFLILFNTEILLIQYPYSVAASGLVLV